MNLFQKLPFHFSIQLYKKHPLSLYHLSPENSAKKMNELFFTKYSLDSILKNLRNEEENMAIGLNKNQIDNFINLQLIMIIILSFFIKFLII